MNCDICKKVYKLRIQKSISKIDYGTQKVDFQQSAIDAKFCYNCGRPLTPPEPLTAGELREMCRIEYGKIYNPVWIKRLNSGKVSCIIASDLLQTDRRYKPPRTWAYTQGVVLKLENYGKTWIAYEREVEVST